LPIQSAAVGRLVETPADIAQTIDNYLAGGTITPTSSLVTGYSFMQPPASEIETAFSTGIPGGTNDKLIASDVDPVNPWTASDLSTALTARAHQLVFLGAHFSANDALAADDTTFLSTEQFAGEIGSDLQGSLVLSAGCHSGYNIDPADATPVTNTLSWPQAFTEAGATLIAGTGYQFGDSNYVADSDQIYVDLAQQFGDEPGPVGTALLRTEWEYLASLDQLNGLDEKSLLQVTLYGLPMLSLHEPKEVPAPSGPTSVLASSDLQGLPGPFGLEEADLSVTPTLTATAAPGTSLSYDSGPQGVVADPGGPVVPVQTEDVNVPGETLRGVGLWSGSYTDSSGPSPLTGDPVTDAATTPAPFSSPVYYPQKIWNPNYFATLGTGGDTMLGVTPVQYVSDPTAPGNAVGRTYSNVDFHLFYDNDTASYGGNVPALAAPPQISDVSASYSNGQVTVSARVAEDPSAGTEEVWATYTDPTAASPQWQSVELTPAPGDPSLWAGAFSASDPANTVLIVQAANGVGEVSLDNNDGYYFSVAGSSPSAPAPAPDSLSLAPVAGATYGAPLDVSATLADAAGPLPGQPVTFGLGSYATVSLTGSDGVARATLPVTGAPGGYALTASYPGDAADQPASTSEAVQVAQAPTALQLSAPSQVTSGEPSGVSATLTSDGAPVPLETVYFEVSSPGGTAVGGGTAITNESGVARPEAVTLPPGDVGSGYTMTAYFGSSSTPLPPPTGSYDAADPDYQAATSPGSPVTVDDTTVTTLVAQPSPANFGQSVTLTATVSPSGVLPAPTWPTGPGATYPSGEVTFSDAGNVIGSAPLSLGAGGVGSASLTVEGLQGGTHLFSASYAGNANLDPSTGEVSEGVGFTETIGGAYTGPLVVVRGQNVLVTGHVSGPVVVEPGGGLEVEGGSVTGPISSTRAVGFTLCGATVAGPVVVSRSTGFVFIGGGTDLGCGPTTVSGPVSLVANTGGVEVAGDTVYGPVAVSANSGSGPYEQDGSYASTEIAGNDIFGPLACAGNTPPPTDEGEPNTALLRSGQCAHPRDF
ncbi:MAG: Ig-like domain repeat protein, partial [Acidimicrobiales bacterium]